MVASAISMAVGGVCNHSRNTTPVAKAMPKARMSRTFYPLPAIAPKKVPISDVNLNVMYTTLTTTIPFIPVKT
jgi:hypothetical protein